MIARRLLVAMAVLAAWLVGGSLANGQEDTIDAVQEYNVKSAFLYSFGRYVTWPQEKSGETGGKFVVAVLGESAIAEPLGRVAASRQVGGMPIVVRHAASADKLPACHILFISRYADAAQIEAAIKRFDGASVLVVGESPGLAETGKAGVNFFLNGDAISFEINAANTQRQKLHLNAKLLSLGRRIGN